MEDTELLSKMRSLGHMLYHGYPSSFPCGRMLRVLYREGPMSQCRLAENLGIRPASLSEMADKAQSQGLIERGSRQEDKRCSLLQLTDLGRQQAIRAEEERKKTAEFLFSPLSDDEKEALKGMLDKLQSHWKEGMKHE